jgi:hypothetical protein
MGKASEFDASMEGRRQEPGEVYPARPEVHVRDDAPAIDITNETSIEGAVSELGSKTSVVLRSEGQAMAVLLSAERYAELAGCAIESEDRFKATLHGTIEPDPDALRELMIEQVDPAAEWKFGSRILQDPQDR